MTKPDSSDQPEDAQNDDVPTESERSEPLMAELEKAPPAPEEPVVKRPAAKKERPVMPTAREAAAEVGGKPAPAVIRWAFYLVVAAVLIGVFGGFYLLLNKESLIQSALEFEGREPITRAEAEQTVTNAVWVLIIVNVIFGAFQALFAYKAREGQRRARMLVTIATVMVVLFHYMLVPTLFGQLAGLVAAIGVALMFLPASRNFFPPRQSLR